MNGEISEDIFYQVKKEILDKLDIILQKINLQFLRCDKKENFVFIELAQFETEISCLFTYLDKLYESLNSSSSACTSSYSTFKSSNFHALQLENEELLKKNKELFFVNTQLLNQNEHLQSQFRQISQNIVIKTPPMQAYKQILSECIEMKQFIKGIKGTLKEYRFSLLEDRVEIIAKLKQFQQERKQNTMTINALGSCNQDHQIHNSLILKQLSNILDLC